MRPKVSTLLVVLIAFLLGFSFIHCDKGESDEGDPDNPFEDDDGPATNDDWAEDDDSDDDDADDDDGGEDDDSTPDDDATDDDAADDDTADDDTTDDDATDDDDDTVNPLPQISDAYWDPAVVAYDSEVGGWVSWVEFDVCDEDDDLSGGGIYIYENGTSDLIWEDPIWWDDFTGGAPSAPNCALPQRIAAGTIFSQGTTPPGWGNINFCVDLEVTDGAGHKSNKIMNLCVLVP